MYGFWIAHAQPLPHDGPLRAKGETYSNINSTLKVARGCGGNTIGKMVPSC
jgi:hypothetical protein